MNLTYDDLRVLYKQLHNQQAELVEITNRLAKMEEENLRLRAQVQRQTPPVVATELLNGQEAL